MEEHVLVQKPSQSPHKKNVARIIRLVVGIVMLLVGLSLMIIPFIPLGFVFFFFGLVLVSPLIPQLKKQINWLKKKDKRNIINKTEKYFENILQQKSKKKKK